MQDYARQLHASNENRRYAEASISGISGVVSHVVSAPFRLAR
jgi:hypothetical protein